MAKKQKPLITGDIVNQMQKFNPESKGIVCPFDSKTRCGNWKDLDEYYKWEGEKYCRRSCYKARNNGKKLAKGVDIVRNTNEGLRNKKLSSPGRMAKELYDSQPRKMYEMKVSGRKVA